MHFNICIDFYDWPSEPKIWQKFFEKKQLNDEFDENTMLLNMYDLQLIGLSEHDNDHHHYEFCFKILCYIEMMCLKMSFKK